MDKFLIGAAVALSGTIVGWLLSFATERWKVRRAGRSAARVIFFELGLLLSAANFLSDGEYGRARVALTRDAWERYGRDLFEVADAETMMLLSRIYSSNYAAIVHELDHATNQFEEIADDAWRDLVPAAEAAARIAGLDREELAGYMAPLEEAWAKRHPDSSAGADQAEGT